MWDSIRLPQEAGSPREREKQIEEYAAEKIGEYDGTIFLCVSREDRERRRTFQQAARALGCTARDGRDVCAAVAARDLANRPERNVLFVYVSMQAYLGEYLDACPAGRRHLLLYSRRGGNGPSPHMSGFLDFWLERGVDILDLGEADKKQNEVERC